MAETINIKDLQLTAQIDPSDFLLVEKAEGTRKIAGTIFNSLKGEKGETGPQGPKGETGAIGPQGPVGAAGPKGDQGLQGVPGPKGATGDQGPKGDTGVAGPQGPAGTNGFTWRPAVDGSGNLSWTQNSGTTAPTTINIRGPQGPAGAKGETGATGPQGAAGATGPKGDRGDVGPQGPAVAVVNDLTTGGTTKALSAEQGKAIKDLIDSLTQKLTALEAKVNQNHPS